MKMHQSTATGNNKFHQVWWRTSAVANMEMHQATATENHQEQSLRASCFHAGHENQPVAKTDHENHENHENHDSDENHQAILRYAQVTSRQPPSSERSERDGVTTEKTKAPAGRFIQRRPIHSAYCKPDQTKVSTIVQRREVQPCANETIPNCKAIRKHPAVKSKTMRGIRTTTYCSRRRCRTAKVNVQRKAARCYSCLLLSTCD